MKYRLFSDVISQDLIKAHDSLAELRLYAKRNVSGPAWVIRDTTGLIVSTGANS